jgi:four helix bundle protein
MATIIKFEDIKAWQKARSLTNLIYEVSKVELFAKDFALKDQLRRASISIMLNIAEGFAWRTDKDFARFLNNAHGSAAEVQFALYIALDQSYINDAIFGTVRFGG